LRKEARRTPSSVPKDVTGDVEVLPDDERLDGSHLETFEGIVDSEDELAGVESDLVKELLDQTLLLDELDVAQRVGGELDRLVESVLACGQSKGKCRQSHSRRQTQRARRD
jgi:hypothetical protein